MIKLNFVFKNIGDQVCTTAIPENIFNVAGEKCVITDPKIWAFKHNPYVIHGMTDEETEGLPSVTLMPDGRIQEQAKHFSNTMNTFMSSGQTEYMCVQMGFNDVRLRHPRLYVYEDEATVPHKIVVHTTGSDRAREGSENIREWAGESAKKEMTDDVIASIMRNYRDYEIVQVGGKDDIPLKGKFTDKRGLNYWDTAKEIASAARFIGINSGMMHIANCYPRVDKRIVMMEFSREVLMAHKAGDIRNFSFTWYDPTHTFFNRFDVDAGVTYSHLKI
jgi:hypothetical protein